MSDDWSDPTPCTDWNVRALVNHVVGEDRWTKPLVDGKTIAEVGDAFDGDLLGEDPKGSAMAAADEALTAVAERLPAGGKVHLSYGEEDIAEYICQLVADHLIHGWDLAVATGQNRDLDPELVAEVAEWFRNREEIVPLRGGDSCTAGVRRRWQSASRPAHRIRAQSRLGSAITSERSEQSDSGA